MTKKKLAIRISVTFILLGIGYVGLTVTNAIFSGATLPIEPEKSITDVFGEQAIDLVINGSVIKAELARTDSEKAKGLMNRQSLGSNSGMLFIYDTEEERAFWMKDTFIPLDIIFMDKDKKIVSISSNTKPNQTEELYYSNGKSMYVLELNAGRAEELEIKPGNKITF
jgi:uncharacterized membrane protein (UPF0127 family)